MKIYLMQHGKAFSEDQDKQRRLTPEGEMDIQIAADVIKELEIRFDLILTSTKTRAFQTAEIIAKSIGYDTKRITSTDLLNPTAPPEKIIPFLKGLQAETVLIVGHLPCLAGLFKELTGGEIRFEMGALCCIEAEEPLKERGILLWYILPKHLRIIKVGLK